MKVLSLDFPRERQCTVEENIVRHKNATDERDEIEGFLLRIWEGRNQQASHYRRENGLRKNQGIQEREEHDTDEIREEILELPCSTGVERKKDEGVAESQKHSEPHGNP